MDFKEETLMYLKEYETPKAKTKKQQLKSGELNFLANYTLDCLVFGESVAKEFYSYFCGNENLLEDLNSFISKNIITEELEKEASVLTEEMLGEDLDLSKIAKSDKFNGYAGFVDKAAIPDNLLNQVTAATTEGAKPGIFSGLLGKIKGAFANVDPNSFGGKLLGFIKTGASKIGGILGHGMTWIQGHLPLVLGSAGGLLAISLIIKALKKKKQLSNFPQLQNLDANLRAKEAASVKTKIFKY
jgi:hypothetical protein